MYIVAQSHYLLIAPYMCALLDGYIYYSKDLISVFFPSDASSNPPPSPPSLRVDDRSLVGLEFYRELNTHHEVLTILKLPCTVD